MKPEESNHDASLAVWDVPSRAVTGRPFKIKVGAKCSAGCQLTAAEIEIRDQTSAKVAVQTLGETPWPGTTGLYWSDVELAAPASEGVYLWSAALASEPHQDGSASFSFLAVRPPEHTVTIHVIDRDTRAPIEDAAVRVGLYRAFTGGGGLAEIAVAKGAYDVTVHKVDYEAPPMRVEITGDGDIQVEIRFAPQPPQDPYWG